MVERGPVGTLQRSSIRMLWGELDVPFFGSETPAEAKCTELGMKSFKSAQLFGAQMRVSGRGNCELSQTVTDSSSSKRGKAALSILQMALFCSEIWVHKQLASNSKTSGPNGLHCPRASCRTSESSWHKETVSWRSCGRNSAKKLWYRCRLPGPRRHRRLRRQRACGFADPRNAQWRHRPRVWTP